MTQRVFQPKHCQKSTYKETEITILMAVFMEEANYDEKNSMMYLAISNLFLVFLGVGLVIPVIPQLKEEMHFSGTTMGMMISILRLPN